VYKLTDFGTACYVDHTTTGSRRATNGYMAPEVMMQKPCNEMADMFSFGVVLWELLSGITPNLAGHRRMKLWS